MKLPNFFNKLTRKSSKPKLGIGLDIGQATTRVIAISSNKDKPTISSFSSVPQEKTVLETVRKAINSLPVSDCPVNIGLSGAGVIIRYINLPKMTKEELRGAVQFEAEKHIPFPIKDVFLDAYILNENSGNNQMLVLLAAVKKELVSESMQLMRSARLEIRIIDINALALMNVFFHCRKAGHFKQEQEDKSIALLDIGLKFSSLNIIEGEIPRLSRDISLGTGAFNSANKETVFLNIANELRRSFDFYESQTDRSLEIIYLSGEGAKADNLDETLAQNLTLPIKFWDPSLNCNIADSVDKNLLKSQAHTLAVALGLALR
ncbi:MAG: pilus assembly protein PilM [Candidatus Omnitrophica bacterium]|nr:pilus assembly protein PilM [Candidatus Omnitrophota bacterium]